MKRICILSGILLCLTFCVSGFANDIPGKWTVVDNGDGEGLFLQLNKGGTGKAYGKDMTRAVAVSKAAGSQRKGTFRATGGYYFFVFGEISCPITWKKMGDTLTIRVTGQPSKKVTAKLDLESSTRDLSDWGGYRKSIISQWKSDFPSNEDVQKYKYYMGESLDIEYKVYFKSFLTGKYIFRNDKIFPLHKLYGEAEKNSISLEQFLDSTNKYTESEQSSIQISSLLTTEAFTLAKNNTNPVRSESLNKTVNEIEHYHSCINTIEQIKNISWKDFSVTEDGKFYTFTEKTTGDIFYLPSVFADSDKLDQTASVLNEKLGMLEQFRLDLNEHYKKALLSTIENMTCHNAWYIIEHSNRFFNKKVSKSDIGFVFPILDYTIESCDVLESVDKTICKLMIIVGSKKKYQLSLTGYKDGRIDPLSFQPDKVVDLGKVVLTSEQKQKLKNAKREFVKAIVAE